MVKSRKLVKFEKTAKIFLDFEKEYGNLPQEGISIFSLEIQKEELKSLWEKVKVSYEQFVTDDEEEDSEEDCEAATLLYSHCRNGYVTVGALMGELSKSFLDKPEMSSTQSVRNPNGLPTIDCRIRNSHMKLPPCIMEIFHGDYQSWPSFRDMFTAVYINGADISSVERLFYLRQFTQGEALEIVKKSPLTDHGFQVAWANLKDRYENKRILVNTQLKMLFNLVPVRSESASDIKRLQRDINNSISALRLHDIDISNWDPIFVYLCSTRLPILTLSLWEQTVRNKTENPQWEELDGFLTSRFQSLETVSDIRSFEPPNSAKGPDSDVNSGFKRKVRSYQTKLSKRSCVSCFKDHALNSCPKFLGMDPIERFLLVKRKNLCINCLSDGHRLSECQSSFSCLKCKLKHNTLLHREVSRTSHADSGAVGPSTSQQAVNGNYIQNCFATASRQILLGTAMVDIVHRGEVFKARALIDSGSQATFISEKFQRRLNLPVKGINAKVTGLNDAMAGSVRKECLFVLSSPLNSRHRIEVTGLVLPKLTGRLPGESVSILNSSALLKIQLADPNFTKSDHVDLLIGGDIYPKIMLDGVKRNILGNLMAQESIFGWIITGPLSNPDLKVSTTCVSFFTEVGLDKQLEAFWKLEEPPQTTMVTPEDEYCEELFKITVKRNSSGRYVVSMPFKPQFRPDKSLGISYEKAYRQFLRNESSLMKNPPVKEIYDNVLSEYETLGHMALVDSNDLKKMESYYLPHHAVFKPESSSTKVRVVFNASSRTSSGLSLNDVLFPGPALQNDLTLLIIRWRFYRYVFTGDIEKMYRQILLSLDQTAYQRIVFRRHPDEEVKEFELKTVTFGVNCAPFLAIRTLHQLADDNEARWPLASKILRKMMYVDDALAGAHEISLAIKARDQLIQCLSSAGFSMRKWTSNDGRVLQGLPSDHLLNEGFLEIEDFSSSKTLGVRWNAKFRVVHNSSFP